MDQFTTFKSSSLKYLKLLLLMISHRESDESYIQFA